VSENDPQERAFGRTREAAARERWTAAVLARRRGRPLEPGDLCVLPATEAYPVEWALVERDLEDPGRLLAVPADTFPPAGSADVEVAASETAGPLRLRCRHALWVSEGALAPARRTGVLAPRWLREAGALHEALAAGSHAPSSLAEEIDAESEYRDWERDVLAPARAALERAVAAPPRRRAAVRGFTLAHQLAAVFLFAAVGLGLWVAQLRRQVGAPIVGDPTPVVLATQRSGAEEVLVRSGDSHVVLQLTLDADPEGALRRIEIRDLDGRLIWERGEIPSREAPLLLPVPRKRLPDGTYRIALLAGREVRESTTIEVQEKADP
jgi:hypothetical protein